MWCIAEQAGNTIKTNKRKWSALEMRTSYTNSYAFETVIDHNFHNSIIFQQEAEINMRRICEQNALFGKSRQVLKLYLVLYDTYLLISASLIFVVIK